MDVLVVGGTEKLLGAFLGRLEEFGITPRWHWEWFKKTTTLPFPAHAEGVVLIKNMVGHNISDRAKKEADRRNIGVATVVSKFSLAFPILEQKGWVEAPIDETTITGEDDEMAEELDGTLMGMVLEAITLLADEDPNILLDKEELCRKTPDLTEVEIPEESLSDVVNAVLEQNEWMYHNKLLDITNGFHFYESAMKSFAVELGKKPRVLTLGQQSLRNALRDGVMRGIKLGGTEKTSGKWYTSKGAILEYIDKYLHQRWGDLKGLDELEFSEKGLEALQNQQADPEGFDEGEVSNVVEDDIIVSRQQLADMIRESVTAAIDPLNNKLMVLEGSVTKLEESTRNDKNGLHEKVKDLVNKGLNWHMAKLKTEVDKSAASTEGLEKIKKFFDPQFDQIEECRKDYKTFQESIGSALDHIQDLEKRVKDLQGQSVTVNGGDSAHRGVTLEDLLDMGAQIVIQKTK